MKQYTIIRLNGEIIATGFCDEETFEANVNSIKSIHGEDCFALEEICSSPDSMYYKNGEFINYPIKPIGNYIFDFDKESWVLNIEEEANSIRLARNNLLEQTDWTDTLSAKNRLGKIQYQQWQEYRQSLRDIPQQKDFPLTIVWPTKPE